MKNSNEIQLNVYEFNVKIVLKLELTLIIIN